MFQMGLHLWKGDREALGEFCNKSQPYLSHIFITFFYKEVSAEIMKKGVGSPRLVCHSNSGQTAPTENINSARRNLTRRVQALTILPNGQTVPWGRVLYTVTIWGWIWIVMVERQFSKQFSTPPDRHWSQSVRQLFQPTPPLDHQHIR